MRDSFSPVTWIRRLSAARWASAEATRKPWTTIERVRSLLQPFFRRAMGNDLPTLAASIAYASVLSVFPLLIGVIAVLGRFVQRAYVEETVLAILGHYMPPVALETVRNALEAVVPSSGTAGVFALGGLLWSATAMASAVRHGLNRVLGVTGEGSLWQRKLVELAMIVLVGVLLGLALIVSAMREPLLRLLSRTSNAMFNISMASVLAAVSSWLLVWLAYAIVYRFLPHVRVAWGSLLWGTLVSVPLFEAVEGIFFWYLRVVAHYPIVYGPLVGFVVFMVWVYLLALVLLVGAQVISMLEERRSRHRSAA
jgi:membrane protein